MMITVLTGVSQAGRRHRWRARAPWDPSAEVLASVSLTAGLSLHPFLLLTPLDSPFTSLGRQPRPPASAAGHGPACAGRRPSPGSQRIVPATTGRTADCCATCRSSLGE